jgi:hypothetical protein
MAQGTNRGTVRNRLIANSRHGWASQVAQTDQDVPNDRKSGSGVVMVMMEMMMVVMMRVGESRSGKDHD